MSNQRQTGEKQGFNSQNKTLEDCDDVCLGHSYPMKLSKIIPMPNQPRRYFNELDIILLATSIKEKGQKTPVKVTKSPNTAGLFMLIGGERRFRAMNLIWKETGIEPTIKVIFNEVDLSDKELFKEALIDNLNREDVIEVDEAAAYHRLHFEDKMTIREIADLIGKSVSHVEGRIMLHTLPDNVKSMMDISLPKADRLSVTNATKIATVTDDDKVRETLAKEAVVKKLKGGDLAARIAKIPDHILRPAHTMRNGRVVGSKTKRRRPVDDYQLWLKFLDKTNKDIHNHSDSFDIANLYNTRNDEEGDRFNDAKTIKSIIAKLKEILPLVEETSKERYKRTGKFV